MGRRRVAVVVASAVALGLTVGVPGASAQTAEEHASSLVSQMTMAEKLALVGSGKDGVPRLGVPPMVFIDGPNGVGTGTKGVTALPNAVTLGATFDPAAARRFGAIIGNEAAHNGFAVVGAPTVNILRTPLWGRAAETLGEDPFLSSALVAPEVQGMQSQRVMAQVKHYAANNQELLRFGSTLGDPGVDVRVSERALQEIYYPAFASAVGPGGAASVMCSYNRINGEQACQNAQHLAQLRTFGLRGFVEPDATLAVRDVVLAAKAGVENFQLGSVAGPAAEALGDAVADGQLPSSVVDNAAKDILVGMDRVGLLSGATPAKRALTSTSAHRATAASISAEGTVLLTNTKHVLPLTRSARRLAVIGYDAGPGTQIEENGSPAVLPSRVVTPLAGIRARAPRSTKVTYAAGTRGIVALPLLTSSVLTPSSGGGHGLSAAYYAGSDLTGTPLIQRTDTSIDFASPVRGPLQPIPGTQAKSARWRGTLTPPRTGAYRFSLQVSGRATLKLDGHALVSGDAEWVGGGSQFPGAPKQTFQGVANLRAGKRVRIEITYSVGSAVVGTDLQVGWSAPEPSRIAKAVAAARKADVAVVFANDVTGEGMDRTSLALPGDQDALISAVAKANPRTVVVLHTAGPVLMPWRSRVAAIVEAWYPGQESGNAIAKTLFGDVNPSGHLPQTWPASAKQGPTAAAKAYPGTDDTVDYAEGVNVGYRYYDAKGQTPLFPFGYGLSYTSFALGKPKAKRRAGGGFTVTVPVRNTGRRTGAEVVQAYVGFPAGSGEPPRQLKGFTRITAAPGTTKTATITLGGAGFRVYSQQRHAWVTPTGFFKVYVGTSSRDLSAPVRVTP